MDWVFPLLLLLGGLIFFMALAAPVAIALYMINLIGAYLFLGGGSGVIQLAHNLVSGVGSFALIPIPLFVLMGEVLFHTGLAKQVVEVIERLIHRVPGRLNIVAIIGGSMFATLSGSTVANTAMLGSTLLPEMRNRGYRVSFALGPIIGVGGIAMLIPPSTLAVVLGSLGGISIGALLVGGVIPGLLLAFAYLAYVILRGVLDPSIAPRDDVVVSEESLLSRLGDLMIKVLPLFGIFFCVVGGILFGWATPTESAALGAMASLVAAVCYRRLTLAVFKKCLLETAKLTAMIMFIVSASMTFSQILSISGAGDGLLQYVVSLELSRIEMMFLFAIILLFLGCFMEQISMMLLTVPFFVPLALGVGQDPIALGIMMLVAIEVGLMSPPFGLLVYVMKGVAPDIPLTTIFKSVVPYLAMSMGLIVLIIFVPEVATWLPSLSAN
ncbi:TRAP transporter large permease [Pusillimonas caeni]|uniref:TRAP transporter large permease n=1 Tax=Pusillimonas caeni TaxID=1348472 RepID=UPI000E59A185|nr:TRAP transporter large permease [Pusillimonas caeni]TFL14866.1 TRAP transporter large permease [Pusillimonas caeni]